MPAGSKISDDKQEYQYSLPFVTPSGHELTFYDTPDNQRLRIKHSSGSHVEFKADGSVFIKAVTDIHTHGSVVSTAGGETTSSDAGTTRQDADQTWEIGGKLTIKCASLDFEIGSTGRIKAGTDLIMSSNNMINKATESISLEGSKSVYIDTKEMTERIVSRKSETGTKEEGAPGGVNVMNVHGNTIIQNDDVNGGITISSKGYLNLVCGQERVDLVGQWTDRPSTEAIGTFTTKVKIPEEPGTLSVSRPGGDVYFESEASAHYNFASTSVDPKYVPYGYQVLVTNGDANFDVQKGNYLGRVSLNSTDTIGQNRLEDVGLTRTRTVGGAESVEIQGIQTVKAAKIFLN